ncbi:hypothetical protein B0J14DRAFT_671019 [Halenospora varia]|nr:hypothetical protein B0J14DRAFT_671019 [Halenospora varia]
MAPSEGNGFSHSANQSSLPSIERSSSAAGSVRPRSCNPTERRSPVISPQPSSEPDVAEPGRSSSTFPTPNRAHSDCRDKLIKSQSMNGTEISHDAPAMQNGQTLGDIQIATTGGHSIDISKSRNSMTIPPNIARLADSSNSTTRNRSQSQDFSAETHQSKSSFAPASVEDATGPTSTAEKLDEHTLPASSTNPTSSACTKPLKSSKRSHCLADIMADMKPTPIIPFRAPPQHYTTSKARPFPYFGVKHPTDVEALDRVSRLPLVPEYTHEQITATKKSWETSQMIPQNRIPSSTKNMSVAHLLEDYESLLVPSVTPATTRKAPIEENPGSHARRPSLSSSAISFFPGSSGTPKPQGNTKQSAFNDDEDGVFFR